MLELKCQSACLCRVEIKLQDVFKVPTFLVDNLNHTGEQRVCSGQTEQHARQEAGEWPVILPRCLKQKPLKLYNWSTVKVLNWCKANFYGRYC